MASDEKMRRALNDPFMIRHLEKSLDVKGIDFIPQEGKSGNRFWLCRFQGKHGKTTICEIPSPYWEREWDLCHSTPWRDSDAKKLLDWWTATHGPDEAPATAEAMTQQYLPGFEEMAGDLGRSVGHTATKTLAERIAEGIYEDFVTLFDPGATGDVGEHEIKERWTEIVRVALMS